MRRKTYGVLSLICVIGCIVCLIFAFTPDKKKDTVTELKNIKYGPVLWEASADLNYNKSYYTSPLDFDTLKKNNGDIYAWIDIPNAEMDAPVVQSDGDDTYYLLHDSLGEKNRAGSIYTEKQYNSKNFYDPVTVMYGRKMYAGKEFKNLESEYDTKEKFKENQTITVYLPYGEIYYRVFAAVTYDKIHILDTYDFREKDDYNEFLESVFNSKGIFDDKVKVNHEDRLLVLSTCSKWWNTKKRYIVVAKMLGAPGKPVDPGEYVQSPERTYDFSSNDSEIENFRKTRAQDAGSNKDTEEEGFFENLINPESKNGISPKTFDPVPILWFITAVILGLLAVLFVLLAKHAKKKEEEEEEEANSYDHYSQYEQYRRNMEDIEVGHE